MIRPETMLQVADNSGAKSLLCIRVHGGTRRRYARIGDIISVSVKVAMPNGLVKKGRVLGMDLVEVSPSYDVENRTMFYAERLLCNFMGACVRAGYYD